MATGNNSTYNKGSQSNTRSKTTASRSTSTARSPQKARSSQSSRQASASRPGGRKTKAQLAQEQARKNEIHLFICLAVCTFFFISNFGWCGVVGNFFAKFMFGLFGVMEYIFPIVVAASLIFLISNREYIAVARVKTAAVYILMVLLSAMALRIGNRPDIAESTRLGGKNFSSISCAFIICFIKRRWSSVSYMVKCEV